MKRRNKNSVKTVKQSKCRSKLNSIILVILFITTSVTTFCEAPGVKTVEAGAEEKSSLITTGPSITVTSKSSITAEDVEVVSAEAIRSRFHEVSDTVSGAGITAEKKPENFHEIFNRNTHEDEINYAIQCAYELGKKDAQEEHEKAEAEKERQKAEEEAAEKKKLEEERKKDYYTEGFGIKSSIMSSSGLTAEQIDGLLVGTDLYGIGGPVKDVEDIYGVNAYFTLAVSSLESGYGSSNFAKVNNNIFGMLGKSFNNYSESVYYFGKLMTIYKNSRGLDMSPYGINPTYCTDGSDWDGEVTKLMNSYVRKANEKY